jgi:hypothetical protein
MKKMSKNQSEKKSWENVSEETAKQFYGLSEKAREDITWIILDGMVYGVPKETMEAFPHG